MKLKNKEQIETWLEQGDTELVIAELKRQVKSAKTGKELLPEVLNFAARLEKIIQDKIGGVISYEDETLMLNRLRKDLILFIEAVEKQKAESAPSPVLTKTTAEQSNNNRKGFGWLWLLIPLLCIGIWAIFFKNTGIDAIADRAVIKLCTLDFMANEHCCTKDLSRITLLEAKGPIYVSAVFEGLKEKDPSIQGILYWADSGDPFPTQPIHLTLDETLGHICYSGMISPVHGVRWTPAKYILKLQINGQPAVEKEFEIFVGS